MKTPRKGLDQKDLNNPKRANPAVVGFVLVLVVGLLTLATTLTLNFFTGHFSVFTFIVGIGLIATGVVGLIVKANW